MRFRDMVFLCMNVDVDVDAVDGPDGWVQCRKANGLRHDRCYCPDKLLTIEKFLTKARSVLHAGARSMEAHIVLALRLVVL